MKITLVVDSLARGGASRVLALLANNWANDGWCVSYVTLHQGSSPCLYRLDPLVNYINADFDRVYAEGFPKLRYAQALFYLRKTLSSTHPEIIISFVDSVNIHVLLAMCGSRVPIIVSERNDPHYDLLDRKRERLRTMLYPRAAALVAQTHGALGYFPPEFQRRMWVIPNPVISPSASAVSKTTSAADVPKRLLAMGRLVPQKGFDILIRSFAGIAQSQPEWILVIWGEGDQKLVLESMAREMGVGKRVFFQGVTDNPSRVMADADLFVMTSRNEGFPNVLCEAMACGLPVVSFNCPSGPSEIIRDGIDGILVPHLDEQALAAAMTKLMCNSDERNRLGGNAPDIVSRFNLKRISAVWEKLLRVVLLETR